MIIINAQLVLGATNRLNKIDAALVRPGRLELKVFVAPPGLDDRLEIIRLACHQNLGGDVQISQLATKTNGVTAAQLASLCRDAAFVALDQDLNGKTIRNCHFLRAASFQQSKSPMADTSWESFK